MRIANWYSFEPPSTVRRPACWLGFLLLLLFPLVLLACFSPILNLRQKFSNFFDIRITPETDANTANTREHRKWNFLRCNVAVKSRVVQAKFPCRFTR
jgi:hypothetical protein